MSTSARAYLAGGPEDLPRRVVPIVPPGVELKVPFRGGYEHFKVTPRYHETDEGRLPVYEWFERTEVAE